MLNMRTTIRDHSTAFILILLLGGIVYLNSLAGTFQWDDIPHIVRNPAIYNWKDIGSIFYFWPTRCFLFWTLSINYHFSGTNPLSYHLVNAAIHIFSAFLVYLIFFRLWRKKIVFSESYDLRVNRMALFAGLIFVLHPLQTQAVTFIVQRGASMSGFFCLLALYLYCRFRQEGSRLSYVGALVAGIMGIFSKEGAASLPLLIGLWEVFFGPERRWGLKIIDWLPFAILPFLTVIIMWRTVGAGGGGFYYSLNLQNHLPSVGLTDSTVRMSSRWIYLVTQFHVMLTYLRLLFIPIKQTIYYAFPISSSIFRNIPLFSLLLLISILTLAGRFVRSRPIISFGIFFFFLSLIPTSSVIVLLPLVSEHHLYLALAGFAWAVPAVMGIFLSRKQFMVAGGMIILAVSLLTITRNMAWLTPYTLWSDALKKAPHLASLHDSMASVYIANGKNEAAVKESRKALDLDQNYNAYHNLWAAYHNLGDYNRAEKSARMYLRHSPRSAQPHQALALTLIKMGDNTGAEKELLRAIEMQPDLARPHLLLESIYRKRGEYSRAGEEREKAIKLAPYLVPGYYEMKE